MVDGVQNRGVASGWDAMPRWGILEFGFKTDVPVGAFWSLVSKQMTPLGHSDF